MELKKYLKFIRNTVHIRKFTVLIIVFLTVLESMINGIVMSNISKYIIDKVFVEKKLENLIKIIPIYLILYLAVLLINIINSFMLTKWKIYIDYQLKNNFYKKISSAKYINIENNPTTDIYYRMFEDGAFISGYVYVFFIVIPSNLICVLIMLPTLFLWSIPLSLYTLLLVSGELISIIFMRKPLERISDRQKTINQHIIAFIMEKLANIDQSKVGNFTDWWIQKTYDEFEHAKKITYKNQVISTLLSKGIEFYRGLWLIGFLILGGYLSVNNICSVGLFFSFQTLINYLLMPLNKLFESFFMFQQTKVSFRRYMDYYEWQTEDSGDKTFKFKDSFEVKNLMFSYSNQKNVLNHISFKLQKNKLVCIKGESGSGKTTLMKICSRLLDPEDGEVLIDDTNIRDIDICSFRDNVNFMLQNTVLYEDSFRNNLCLGKDIDDNELCTIIEKCHLKFVVDNLPQNMNSEIGKGKAQFSKGEVQRIALARALIRKPSILWLDEPTAALDEETERIIIHTILELKEEMSCLVIVNTHSSRMLAAADQIVEL